MSTTTPIPDDKWMSYEDYKVQQSWLAQQEAACLRAHGLGWLIDFCSPKKNNDEILQQTETRYRRQPMDS